MSVRFRTLARASAAAVAVVAIAVGVPWALLRVVGWPLPEAWPHLGQLRAALHDGVPDGFWLKAAAIVVWLAWLQLVLALAAEVVSLARGRSNSRTVGFGWAQVVAARLVGAVVVAGGLAGAVPHAGAEAGHKVEACPSVESAVTAMAAPSMVAPGVAAGPATHVVVRGESLSSIAQAELGEARQWPAIWDANRGRSFGPRVFEDPNLILPGWELTLPRPVLIPPVVLPAVDDHLPAGPMAVVAPALAPAAAAEPASTETATATATTATVTQTPAEAPPPPRIAPEPGDHAGAPAWTRLGALLGATLLATGVASMAASARRRALRSGTVTSEVVAPPPEQAEVVTALTVGSDALAMARLELALRALAGQLARAGSEARPIGVRRRDGVIEVVLDRAAIPNPPWAPGADDRAWELSAAVALTDLTDDARAVAPPCPALVGIGRDVDGHEVYVDLEAVGTVKVDRAALRVVTATLAVSPLADCLQVLVVGGGQLPPLDGPHDVHDVSDVAAALAEAEAQTAAAAAAGSASTFRLRAVAGHETWEPVIVVLTTPASCEELVALESLAASRRGVVVIGVDLVEPGLDLTPDAGGWVQVLDWSVRPHGLDEPTTEAIAAVLDGPVVVDQTATAHEQPAAPEPEARQPWTLMVRVLGPVEVVDAEGRAAPFERAKALELVTWLAQHPQSATRAGARAALWAIDVSNASFSNVVSEARRALARLAPPPDGEEWVPRTYAERLPLHPEVVLDADLVRDHLERARRLRDTEAVEELRCALELVRGAPYAGRSYLWPDAEALPSTLTLLVTTVAAELAQRLLDTGDLDGVFAATAVGLEVLPGHEELIALRLRAHARRGDRSALHLEYASYEQAVLADPWDGEPSPALAELRRELLQPVAGD
jgi:hypothetical protein